MADHYDRPTATTLHPKMLLRTRFAVASFLIGAVFIAGCHSDAESNRHAPAVSASSTTPAPTASGSQAAPQSAPGNQSAVKKMNAYTEGFNKLSESFGLRDTMKRYLEINIAARSAKDDIEFGSGWIAQAIPALKQGRAENFPDAQTLDARADALIEALDRLTSLIREVEPYYRSKAYKADNLVRGRAQDILIRKAFEDSRVAYESFEEELELTHRRGVDTELKALAAQGNKKVYAARLGMQQAKDILEIFKDSTSFKKSESYQKADSLIAQLESTLQLQREVEQTLPENATRINYRQLTDSLATMVGEYRSLKESRDTDRFNKMVRHFNVAVGAVNALMEAD